MNVHGSYGARSYRDGRGRAGRKNDCNTNLGFRNFFLLFNSYKYTYIYCPDHSVTIEATQSVEHHLAFPTKPTNTRVRRLLMLHTLAAYVG